MDLLSVVVTGLDRSEESVGCLNMLKKQSLPSLQILLMDPGEDDEISEKIAEMAEQDSRITIVDVNGLNLAEVRNKALTFAQGKYISFISAADCFKTPYALELLVMTAESENAPVVGGKIAQTIGKTVVYPDNIPWNVSGWINSRQPVANGSALASFVFDRNWLIESGIRFYEWSTGSATFFMHLVQVKAQRFFAIGRTLVARGRDAVWERNTDSDRNRNLMEALGQVWPFVKEQNSPEFFDAFENLLFGWGLERLRAGAWSRDSVERDWYRTHLEALEQEKVTTEIINPLVSVIVPAYKVEQYLPRCLDSLVAQTLASIEIIVVDDGSPDKSGEIADDYARRFWNIRVVHQKNGGLSVARNAGMDIARGKYIGFVDGDDYVEPEMFKKMSAALERDPKAEMAICGALVEYSYEVESKEIEDANKYFVVPATGGVDLTSALISRLNASVCTRLYRNDFLTDNRIRFPNGMDNEDEVFFFFTTARATRMQFLKDRFYRYVRNDKGIMAEQAQQFESDESLPDGIVYALPLVFEFLKREGNLDLLGVAYRHLCGCSNRFKGPASFSAISWILHDSGFEQNKEFIVGDAAEWIKNRLSEIANFSYEATKIPPVNLTLLPQSKEKIGIPHDPILSYIVPVYNAADYLAVSIDSLRRQTRTDIEMIFVDDGSLDRSGEILDEIAKKDARVRVFHQENAGVGAARNRGMKEAKGKYIAFVDADDYLDLHAAEDMVALCEKHRLDACLFDFVCFDYKTHKETKHYWTFANHPEIPRNRVFVPRELPVWNFFSSMCGGVFRRDFFVSEKLKFSGLKIGEDFCVFFRFLLLANRVYVNPKVYYHYRRGNPSSAVSRLTAGTGTQSAEDSQVAMLKAYASLVEDCSPRLSARAFSVFLKRCYVDVLFYAERNAKVAQLIQTECRQALLVDSQTPQTLGDGLYQRLQKVLSINASDENMSTPVLPGVPRWVECSIVSRLQEVTDARKTAQQDLYLVTGQLNSKTNEPIDSWTFFTWLQDHNIPSRYLIWREHAFYKKLVREGQTKDVVALKGDGCTDYEILYQHSDLLVRAKALVQENVAMNPILWRWIANLPGCERVFLQHGITFWDFSTTVSLVFGSNNSINVSSAREKKFLEDRVSIHPDVGVLPRYIVAGLPRYDLLKDERKSDCSEFVLFVMFTRRVSFAEAAHRSLEEGRKAIQESLYTKNIRHFLCDENILRLKRAKVRIVLSMHHEIMNNLPDFVLSKDVEIISTGEVSYWIRHADACLTDFSSVSFDFAFQHKPTLYWIPDVGDSSLVDLDQERCFSAQIQLRQLYNVAKKEEDVLAMVEVYAKKNFVLEPEKCAIADTFFACKKDVCQHIYEGIEAVIKERQNEQ